MHGAERVKIERELSAKIMIYLFDYTLFNEKVGNIQY